jgi:hypothetical protein
VSAVEIDLPVDGGDVLEVCAGCEGCDACQADPGSDPFVTAGSTGDGWAAATQAQVEYVRRVDAYHGRHGADAQRAEIGRRNVRVVDAADRVPWRGFTGLTETEREAFQSRELPGASPRLAAYIGRLSDGPTVVWAWWQAWAALTDTPQRFTFDDRSHREDWYAGARKSPEQIAARVRRLRFDTRTVSE